MLACSLIGNIWQMKHKEPNEIKKENQDFPQSYMSVFSITENHNVPKERMDLPLDFREHGVSGWAHGGSRPRAQKESQVAKAAERDTRSRGSAGSRDPAAPLPLPQSSNKLPWMLRFLDSFLSLSHISFAPSWQSVRAVTVQLWKSSQYLARNRTKRKQVDFGGAGRTRACAPAPPAPPRLPPPRGLCKPLRAPPPTSPPPPRPSAALPTPRPTRQATLRGQRPPRRRLVSLSRRGPSSREPGRTRCAALAPRPAQTDCSSSSGKARKTVLSLASCRPLMPLSLQDGLLAQSAALPAWLLRSPPPGPFRVPPPSPLRYPLAFARTLPPPFLLFPVHPFPFPSLSSSFSLPSVFLCSAPHFPFLLLSPLLCGPPWPWPCSAQSPRLTVGPETPACLSPPRVGR